jgi:hypothetical protein
MSLNQLLLKPVTFFYELDLKSPDMKLALLIVFLAGYLNASWSIIGTRNLLPTDIRIPIVLINLILGGAGLGLLFWLWAWLPLKLVSGIKTKRFEIAAWTLFPQCLAGLIWSILSIFFPFYTTDSNLVGVDGKIYPENMEGFLTSPFLQTFRYLFYAWCIYLLFSAVIAVGRNKKRAYLAAGISLFPIILFKLTSFIFTR